MPPISPSSPQPQVETFMGMSVPELITRFAIGVENFDRRAVALNDQQLDMAFLPEANVGRWPVRVLLGHLADAELPFVHRMRLVVGQENPILQPWDENAFIDAGMYGTDRTPPEKRQHVGAFIATIYTLRKWTTEWLKSLDASAFERKGLHAVRGEQTLKTILVYDTWHLEHHAWYLNAKIKRLMGG